jgi:putative DNA primase/helicase
LSLWISKGGRLRAHCFAGCSEIAVLAALSCTEEAVKPTQTDAELEAEINVARQIERNARMAQALFEAAFPIDPNDVVGCYLRETRCLSLPSSVLAAFRGGVIRHPTGSYWPAMLARVDDPEGAFTAIHRTWLDPTGNKAPVAPQRALLGPQSRGAVRLFDHLRSWELLVGEGIETCLAAGELDRWQRSVWSAISTTGLMSLHVPKRFRRVIVAADNDANGAGEQAANVLARRLRKQGVAVQVRMPPEVGTDWNDWLLAKHRGKT